MAGGAEILRAQWAQSCERLERIVAGLTDDEFFWEPCDGCWSVRHGPDGWLMDYPDEVPDPPPVTTIAWRLLHIAHGNWIYAEHAFGPGELNFPDLEIHGTASSAAADLLASQRPVTAALRYLDDAGLDREVPTQFGGTWPAGEVLRTLLDEQVHHGAEISLLRDLYRNRSAFSRPAR
ncbi:MAG TPA: DinB family protein [Kribbellaceae bacterium]|nr:DinB family protein [Kribbellaceae bacterium]